MTQFSPESADKIYACLRDAVVEQREIQCIALAKMTKRQRDLAKFLKENERDDFWRSLLSPIKQFSFEASATLLPCSDDFLLRRDPLGLLKRERERVARVFPEAINQYDLLWAALSETIESDSSSVVEQLEEIVVPQVPTLVAVCESRLVQPVATWLKGLGRDWDLRVLHSNKIAHETPAANAIVIGPVRWHHPGAMLAPRAKKTVNLGYAPLQKIDKQKSLFPRPSIYAPVSYEAGNASSGVSSPQEDTEDFLGSLKPQRNWDQLLDRVRREASDLSTDEELVEARMFIVESGNAIYLRCDGQTKTHVLDLEDPSDPVKNIYVDDIEVGNAILTRGDEPGDYIRGQADAILELTGMRGRARSAQSSWKKALIDKCASFPSHADAVRALKQVGCQSVSAQNLRNWMSEGLIKTKSKTDFEVLLSFCGYEGDPDTCWSLMEEIDSAHRSAGMQIKSALLNGVRDADLSELNQNGCMNFNLTDVHVRSLRADVVSEISPSIEQIPRSVIGHLMNAEIDQWHE